MIQLILPLSLDHQGNHEGSGDHEVAPTAAMLQGRAALVVTPPLDLPGSVGLLPLRKSRHAFQVAHCVSLERARVDYENRLTFSKYSNVTAILNMCNCCHSLDIAPIRLLFPSMLGAATAHDGYHIDIAVGFAM